MFDAVSNNLFGYRNVELETVKDDYLPNNFEHLSRLYVEDLLTKYNSDNPIHFRVLISKKSLWADDSQLIFSEQQGDELGLGVQERKIMKKNYYELYAILIPNDNFKSLQQHQMQRDEFLQLFLDESDEVNNTFELSWTLSRKMYMNTMDNQLNSEKGTRRCLLIWMWKDGKVSSHKISRS